MTPSTKILDERAAEWLEDPSPVPTLPSAAGSGRYTALLFRAFLGKYQP